MKCDLCGGEMDKYGNNAEPILRNGRCCDKCNLTEVIPARLRKAKEVKNENNNEYQFRGKFSS